MIKFTVKNRNSGETQKHQSRQEVIILGRSPKCDVVLGSSTVSRQHAQIIVKHGVVEIQDLGSGNGTFVNQSHIENGQRVPLKAGDQIRIEEFDILIDPESLSEKPEIKNQAGSKPVSLDESITTFDKTDPELVEVKMIKKILGALDHDKRPCVFVTTEPFQDLKVYIEHDDQELLIGRDPECDLTIDSAVISRKQARISCKWGGFVVTDLGSKNKTFVNGEEIEEKTLHDGDEISFGTIKAIFKNPQEFSLEAISKSIDEDTKQQELTGITRVKENQDMPSEQARITADQSIPQKKETPPESFSTEKPEEPSKSVGKEKSKKSRDNQKSQAEEKSSADGISPLEKSETKTKTHVQKTGLLSGLSLSEKLLLAFGVILLAGLVWVLKSILQ